MRFVVDSICETQPGSKWQEKFNLFWPSYRKWFLSEGVLARPGYLTSFKQLRKHMPELIPLYEALVDLAGGGDLAARYLSLYCPPPYMTGCSQAIWPQQPSKLIRNYDYSTKWCEGTLLLSSWRRPVIAMIDSLWGVLDGINDAGLSVALAFGGRKVVGKGFGIPLLLRYVLEVCDHTAQAIDVLKRIPVHMTYNVLVLDVSGAHASIYLNPDREAVVAHSLVETNHQEEIEWPDYAQFSKTIERKAFLEDRLSDPDEGEEKFVRRFLQKPIYQKEFDKGFGTLYTAVYDPKHPSVGLYWPNRNSLQQTFNKFIEKRTVINLRTIVRNQK